MKHNQLDVATKEVKLNAVHADPVKAVPKKTGQVSIPLDDDDDDDQLVDVSKHKSVLPESDRVEEEEVEVEKVEKSKLVMVKTKTLQFNSVALEGLSKNDVMG